MVYLSDERRESKGYYALTLTKTTIRLSEESTELRNKRLIVKLKREYRQTVDELERLTGKYPYDHIESQVNELFQRQRQIIKEIETCTGIEVPIKTRQDILEENKKIQSEGDKK